MNGSAPGGETRVPGASFSAKESDDQPQEFHVFLRPKATLLRLHDPIWHPPTDVYETEDGYQVKMELAGMRREEIQIVLSEGFLVVRGVREEANPVERVRFRQMEIKYGAFEVRMKIPHDVEQKEIEARYDNGFLRARLPRMKKSSGPHGRITVPVD